MCPTKLIEIQEQITSLLYTKKADFENIRDSNDSLILKWQRFIGMILPLHMSVMSDHGFLGENGYLQAQRALMDYYYDPFIKEKAHYAQKFVFEKTNIN